MLNRDEDALARFTQVVEAHQRDLFAFLRGMLGNPEAARDVAQEAFIAGWRVARRGGPPFGQPPGSGEVRRWLWRVAYCRAISHRRHGAHARWEPLAAHEKLAGGAAFEDQVVEQAALGAALAELLPIDAACLTLIIVQGFTTAEAARIMGESPQAIARRFTRAKQRLLARYLAQNPPEGGAS